jgi:hypothetical protein
MVPPGILSVYVDMSLGVLGEVCLCAASLETVDNGKVSEPIAVDLGLGCNPVGCVEWQGECPDACQQWCPL